MAGRLHALANREGFVARSNAWLAQDTEKSPQTIQKYITLLIRVGALVREQPEDSNSQKRRRLYVSGGKLMRVQDPDPDGEDGEQRDWMAIWRRLAKQWRNYVNGQDAEIRTHRVDYLSHDSRRRLKKYWPEWEGYSQGDGWATFRSILKEIAKSEGLRHNCGELQRKGLFWLWQKGKNDNRPNWEKVVEGAYRSWGREDSEEEGFTV